MFLNGLIYIQKLSNNFAALSASIRWYNAEYKKIWRALEMLNIFPKIALYLIVLKFRHDSWQSLFEQSLRIKLMIFLASRMLLGILLVRFKNLNCPTCVCVCVWESNRVSLCEPFIHLLTYFGYLQMAFGFGPLAFCEWIKQASYGSTCASRLLSALDWFTVKMHLPLTVAGAVENALSVRSCREKYERNMQSARFAVKFHNE